MIDAIFYFLAGLAILLFGVKYMSTSLGKVTGGRVRKVINKFSRNRLQCFGVGFLTTLLLQSSTASTIMLVSFASSGIITLFQAIGMIIGSNVGTTLTAFVLSFKSINAVEILSVFAIIGIILNYCAKNRVVKETGNVLFGFGLLFCGMLLIDEATTVFKGIESFNSFIMAIQNPFLLVLMGICITLLTQSSFGTIAIMIALAGTGVDAYSLISLRSISFVVFGANIGTCFTTLLASFQGNEVGKRVAFYHLFFNIFGTVVFMLLSLTNWTNLISSMEPSIAVVIVNIVFNIATTVILLPFEKFQTKLMGKMFRGNKNNKRFDLIVSNLDIPAVAIKQINNAMVNLFDLLKAFGYNLKGLVSCNNLTSNQKLLKELSELDGYADLTQDSILSISGRLTEGDEERLSKNIEVLQNYKRIVHNFGEIVDSFLVNEKPIILTENQKRTIVELCDETINIINAYRRIYTHILSENFEFDFEGITKGVMQCTSYITQIKNEQKELLLDEIKSKKAEKYVLFLNITNQFDEIGNNFNDISVNLAELVKDKE